MTFSILVSKIREHWSRIVLWVWKGPSNQCLGCHSGSRPVVWVESSIIQFPIPMMIPNRARNGSKHKSHITGMFASTQQIPPCETDTYETHSAFHYNFHIIFAKLLWESARNTHLSQNLLRYERYKLKLSPSGPPNLAWISIDGRGCRLFYP